MTYAFILIKGIPDRREKTLAMLTKLTKNSSFSKRTGTVIEQVFVSFGWPDLIVLLSGNNVELLKNSIIEIRSLASRHHDNLETSTIICTTEPELRKNRSVSKKLGK